MSENFRCHGKHISGDGLDGPGRRQHRRGRHDRQPAARRDPHRPAADGEVNRHFQMVDTHFQRAMDAVEGTRDMVIGSFELFSNQTALRTNAVMRVLTILTALMGGLAVVAGVLGMNFKAPFFDTGLAGFVAAIGFMAALCLGGLITARWRKWM